MIDWIRQSESIFGVVYLKVRVLLPFSLCLLAAIPVVAADASTAGDDAIVQSYVMAARSQDSTRKAASMDIEIEASLPSLKKVGRFHALRRISPLGLITYEKRRFEGDNTVRNQVILRYLSAEADTQREPSPALAVTPEVLRHREQSDSNCGSVWVASFCSQ